jgi:hypothetical protein
MGDFTFCDEFNCDAFVGGPVRVNGCGANLSNATRTNPKPPTPSWVSDRVYLAVNSGLNLCVEINFFIQSESSGFKSSGDELRWVSLSADWHFLLFGSFSQAGDNCFFLRSTSIGSADNIYKYTRGLFLLSKVSTKRTIF